MTFFQRLKFKWIRTTHYEYWPFIVFYFPMFFYGLYLALKARSLTYFTNTNPSMKYGGIMGESKKKVLDLIDSQYLPKTIFVKWPSDVKTLLLQMKSAGLGFPLVAKPNIGERGTSVEKIEDESKLQAYLGKIKEEILLQEFIDYPIEVGVLYYRIPDEKKGHISSVVVKGFLEITGDGKKNIRSLIEDEIRAYGRLDYLKEKFGNELDKVLPAGESIVLEPIGNHCRGTTFFNGNHLINQQLEEVFNTIAGGIEGFFYGRFDLKVKSVEDLFQGQNIKILELNGVSSEPAHIYDPNYKLFNAYRDVVKHMRIIYKISRINRKSGYKNDPFPAFIKDLRFHLKRNKERELSTQVGTR